MRKSLSAVMVMLFSTRGWPQLHFIVYFSSIRKRLIFQYEKWRNCQVISLFIVLFPTIMHSVFIQLCNLLLCSLRVNSFQ